MKKIFILMLILFCSITIFAEVISLKNGEKIKGKIISADDNSITVETSFGKMVIDKEKIETIIYDDSKISEKEESKKNKDDDDEEKELENRLKNDILYQRYKSLLNAGIGFIIPGAICTLTPLIFFTPLITSALQQYGATLFNYPLFVFGFTWYAGVMGVGILLDVAAIIFFVFAGKTFNDWMNSKKISKITIYSDFNGANINLGVGLKL
ncbi:MAG: hypothetical protein JXB50_03475 [Spirochaetes bacterium]|nr:hypothetical protein [Spirochaetota bacterium]